MWFLIKEEQQTKQSYERITVTEYNLPMINNTNKVNKWRFYIIWKFIQQ